MALVTDATKYSQLTRAWRESSLSQSKDSCQHEDGQSLSARLLKALSVSLSKGAVTATYDVDSQHILYRSSNSGEWQARFKPGAMRACYESFIYDFFKKAGHEQGACPVSAAIVDLSSLSAVRSQELNPEAFLDQQRLSLEDFFVMSEDLFNGNTALHHPKEVEKINKNTPLQPSGLAFGVIAPRIKASKEIDLVEYCKTLILITVLGGRDMNKANLIGSRLIDGEEIMAQAPRLDAEIDSDFESYRTRSSESVTSISSVYGGLRHLEEQLNASISSQQLDNSDDEHICFTEEAGLSTLCPNSPSDSLSESEEETQATYSHISKLNLERTERAKRSADQMVLDTEIHLPILGEELEKTFEVLTVEQLEQLKEFVRQLDFSSLTELVEKRDIDFIDERLEILELDLEDEDETFTLKDGHRVSIAESGREPKFFPRRSLSDTRLFTDQQIEDFKTRLSRLKEYFRNLNVEKETNLFDMISNIVPSFGHACQTLAICRLAALSGHNSGLHPMMQRKLHLDGEEESFLASMFMIIGREPIKVSGFGETRKNLPTYLDGLRV